VRGQAASVPLRQQLDKSATRESRVVGCDYELGRTVNTDQYLILCSGMQMGMLWINFTAKPQNEGVV